MFDRPANEIFVVAGSLSIAFCAPVLISFAVFPALFKQVKSENWILYVRAQYKEYLNELFYSLLCRSTITPSFST